MSRRKPPFKEEKGVRYILVEGSYIPDIVKPMKAHLWGKFQRARARFLLNHRRDILFRRLFDGTLVEHLEGMEDLAADMIHDLMAQMLKAEPIPESLKDTDTLRWVGLMNNYRYSAEEIVMRDLVYPEGIIEEMEDMMEEIPDFDIDEVFVEVLPEQES